MKKGTYKIFSTFSSKKLQFAKKQLPFTPICFYSKQQLHPLLYLKPGKQASQHLNNDDH